MTELTFTKSFLQNLDRKPTKLLPTHIEDPRNYPSRSAYILPKQPNPLKKRVKTIPGAILPHTINLTSRSPPLTLTLPSLPPTTSILDIKNLVSSQTSIPLAKVRLLFAKKPVGDAKVLKDLVPESDGRDIELGIMVIGGAAGLKKREEEEEEVPVAQGSSGREELKGEAFWGDLKGFLVQRLRDENEGERLYGTFRKAWEKEQR